MTGLGEQPTPHVEDPEPPPGGVDAVDETLYEEQPLVPDLSEPGNGVDLDDIPDEVSDEISETDPTDTAATRGDDEVEQSESSG